jgi:hypothetical protein
MKVCNVLSDKVTESQAVLPHAGESVATVIFDLLFVGFGRALRFSQPLSGVA